LVHRFSRTLVRRADQLLHLHLGHHAGGGGSIGGIVDGTSTTIIVGAPTGAGTGRRACLSRRSFRIRLRGPRGDRLRRATVYVNGHRVRVLRGKRLRSRVNLRGLPRGRVIVKIQGVTRKGRHVREIRRYRTCTPKRRR